MPQTGQEARPRSCSSSRLPTETIQSGTPDSTAVTVRFGVGAQDANVFITFDVADRHTMQARPACTEIEADPLILRFLLVLWHLIGSASKSVAAARYRGNS